MLPSLEFDFCLFSLFSTHSNSTDKSGHIHHPYPYSVYWFFHSPFFFASLIFCCCYEPELIFVPQVWSAFFFLRLSFCHRNTAVAFVTFCSTLAYFFFHYVVRTKLPTNHYCPLLLLVCCLFVPFMSGNVFFFLIS